ncbi:MAG: hypothetical protein ACREOU_12760 [Candidatus Eiseniibacteriota bacterium]
MKPTARLARGIVGIASFLFLTGFAPTLLLSEIYMLEVRSGARTVTGRIVRL